MKNFAQTYSFINELLREKLIPLGYIFELEECNISRELKQAISNTPDNLKIGNKVIFLFSENFKDDTFSLEHHYSLDDKKFVLEDEHPFHRPNKLSTFAKGRREEVNSQKLINNPEEVQMLVEKVTDYFQRLEAFNKKKISIAV